MIDGSTSITIKSNGGDTPRAWSTIKYTVSVNVPTDWGTYTADIPNVQSKNKKSDTFADVVPATVGSEHPASITANILTCDIYEEWAMAECVKQPSGGAGRRRLLGGASGVANTGGGGSGIPGGGGSSGSGGEGGIGGNPSDGGGIPP